ncbi:hypothetical protein [Kitasatospora sp. NBC_01539]|uniref:hypothetical protein n=1 Tax=Kitasatospora sp. NBC_01539 TaxID=2903577 RepID=UPI0038601C96
MTTLSDNAASDPARAGRLRDGLTDRLIAQKTITSDAAEKAFRTVPRECFLPGFPLEAAYADNPAYTKADGSGTQISAASQPAVVALMLEQLDARPGERVFEAAADPDAPAARNLLRQLTGRTGESGDGYALRDLLAHPGARSRLGPARTKIIERALGACALGSATLPATLRSGLEEALDHAAAVLEKSPFDPGSPGGNPLERRARTAPSSDAPHR